MSGAQPRPRVRAHDRLGPDGPLAGDVGHDINYLSIAGVLWHLGPEGHAPVPPINLLADFGGGGSLVVMGILAALVERGRSGEGQVVDAAMVDGSAQLMSIFFGIDAMGGWGPRGTNLLDGGAHFYNVYETADGGYVSLAAYEPKFYANFLRARRAARFRRPRPRAADGHGAVARVEGAPGGSCSAPRPATSGSRSSPGTEVCFAPVLPMSRGARASAQRRRARRSSTSAARPTPRRRRASAARRRAVQGVPVKPGADTDTALRTLGVRARGGRTLESGRRRRLKPARSRTGVTVADVVCHAHARTGRGGYAGGMRDIRKVA